MSLGAVSAGDTGYVLVSAALVMIMTPGLAFFYGGLVRRKNFLSIMMQSFISMGVVTAIWVIFGYSLAFGHDHGGIIGGLNYLGLHNVGEAPGPWAPHIPAAAHFVFQEMFAIITPALITGAFADRVKFKSYLWFLVAVEHPRLHPLRPLDLGRRLPRQVGRARLRRRHGRARQRRLRRPGLRVRGRQATLPARRAQVAAQRGLRSARHRPAVVRLVRLQCGFGARPPTALPRRRS